MSGDVGARSDMSGHDSWKLSAQSFHFLLLLKDTRHAGHFPKTTLRWDIHRLHASDKISHLHARLPAIDSLN